MDLLATFSELEICESETVKKQVKLDSNVFDFVPKRGIPAEFVENSSEFDALLKKAAYFYKFRRFSEAKVVYEQLLSMDYVEKKPAIRLEVLDSLIRCSLKVDNWKCAAENLLHFANRVTNSDHQSNFWLLSLACAEFRQNVADSLKFIVLLLRKNDWNSELWRKSAGNFAKFDAVCTDCGERLAIYCLFRARRLPMIRKNEKKVEEIGIEMKMFRAELVQEVEKRFFSSSASNSSEDCSSFPTDFTFRDEESRMEYGVEKVLNLDEQETFLDHFASAHFQWAFEFCENDCVGEKFLNAS